MARTDIPDIVVSRLPIYLRALTRLQQNGMEITSSHQLGQWLGLSSAQIRKDLSQFGEFGKQGTGYHIATLITHLQRILRADLKWKVVLVGIGDLGRALAHYSGFAPRGFEITHLFDADTSKIGTTIRDLTIQPISILDRVVSTENIKIAMLTTPADATQEVADRLTGAGIRAILNYAPITISVPDTVWVQYIDPVIHLQHMAYYLE